MIRCYCVDHLAEILSHVVEWGDVLVSQSRPDRVCDVLICENFATVKVQPLYPSRY